MKRRVLITGASCGSLGFPPAPQPGARVKRRVLITDASLASRFESLGFPPAPQPDLVRA